MKSAHQSCVNLFPSNIASTSLTFLQFNTAPGWNCHFQSNLKHWSSPAINLTPGQETQQGGRWKIFEDTLESTLFQSALDGSVKSKWIPIAGFKLLSTLHQFISAKHAVRHPQSSWEARDHGLLWEVNQYHNKSCLEWPGFRVFKG